jgi:hypothetical protein
MGVSSTLRVTWALPRVALEHGLSLSARAGGFGKGKARRMQVECYSQPKADVSGRADAKAGGDLESLASSLRPWATDSSADWKQAPSPTANSCSGLVLGPPGPPMFSGTESWTSRRPSEVRPWPARPLR